MEGGFLIAAAAVMLSFVGGAVRLLKGPTRGDRMMGAQLFGTSGAMTAVLLAAATDRWLLLDAALIFAALAAVTVIAFVQRGR